MPCPASSAGLPEGTTRKKGDEKASVSGTQDRFNCSGLNETERIETGKLSYPGNKARGLYIQTCLDNNAAKTSAVKCRLSVSTVCGATPMQCE